jgi:Fe-S cluster assembly ATP-binding protein
MLKLKNLKTNIDNKTILNGIDFEFQKGKIYAIMGPNGSGKSTLSYAIMGHPAYEVSEKSEIVFEGEDIMELDANERAQKGIFLSFQSPLALTGVKVYQLLQLALQGKKNL